VSVKGRIYIKQSLFSAIKADRVNDKFEETPGDIFLVWKMIANGCQLLI
jgi:hypothetical protein